MKLSIRQKLGIGGSIKLAIQVTIRLFILNDASIDQILLQMEDEKPDIMIIDSIHALTSNDLDSPLGSISHLKTSSQTLSEYCKKNSVILVLICHITKDGTIAGPKTLEHLVDTVLYFDQIESDELRILRTTKNRFGPTNEIGIFKMTEKALVCCWLLAGKIAILFGNRPILGFLDTKNGGCTCCCKIIR